MPDVQLRQEERGYGVHTAAQTTVKLVTAVADYWYPVMLISFGMFLIVFGAVMY